MFRALAWHGLEAAATEDETVQVYAIDIRDAKCLLARVSQRTGSPGGRRGGLGTRRNQIFQQAGV
jgi:hypothetical protein